MTPARASTLRAGRPIDVSLPYRTAADMRLLIAVLVTAVLVPSASAQDESAADTLTRMLPEVRVEAVRAAQTPDAVPFAVTRLARPADLVATSPSLGLASVLRSLPGVWIADRGHFALGERIVVRGMGWRSAFGVRGVQLLLDGIPLTMPDGQAVTEIIDPLFIRHAEALRGPASLFWGNAGGGVLLLSTDPGRSAPRLRGRLLGGAYGLRQMAIETAVPLGRHRARAWASDVRQDGFRAYSTGRLTRGGTRIDLAVGRRTHVRLAAAFADQDTQHPGSLTEEQAALDPRGADPRYIETGSGKQSRQVQVGATVLRPTAAGLLTATAYGITRDLGNPLPYAYIDVDRRAGGLRLFLQNDRGPVRWNVGADAALQRDDRYNFDNDAGRPSGPAALDQREEVGTAAVFGVATVPLTARLALTGGLRVDRLHFALDDRLAVDGDDGGTRAFTALSPAAGLGYRGSFQGGDVVVFANYSTAFETPTTTELVNRPGGAQGLNDALAPQRTRGPEVGLRGRWTRLDVDAAAYRYRVTGGILPFQDEGGRTYYRNAEDHLHLGLETTAAVRRAPFTADAAYTFTRLRFETDDAAGRRLPGVPPHRLVGGLGIDVRGLRARLEAEHAAAYFADDANTATVDGYTVLDVDLGYTGLRRGRLGVAPFLRVSNVLDQRYTGAVTVNAFGARYFDPAAGRTLQIGVTAEIAAPMRGE